MIDVAFVINVEAARYESKVVDSILSGYYGLRIVSQNFGLQLLSCSCMFTYSAIDLHAVLARLKLNLFSSEF